MPLDLDGLHREADEAWAEVERLRALVSELTDALDNALMLGANRELVERARAALA